MTQNKAASVSRFLSKITEECDVWSRFDPIQGSDGNWYPSVCDKVSLYNAQGALDFEQDILDEGDCGITLDILEVVPDKEYAIIAVQW